MTGRDTCVGLLALLAGGALSCDRGIPLPRLPQVEQASEVVQGGRLRSHQTCSKSAAGSADALIDCMAGFGYEFIARGSGYPAAECWDAREHRGDGRLPAQYCFLRGRAPGAGTPEPER